MTQYNSSANGVFVGASGGGYGATGGFGMPEGSGFSVSGGYGGGNSKDLTLTRELEAYRQQLSQYALIHKKQSEAILYLQNRIKVLDSVIDSLFDMIDLDSDVKVESEVPNKYEALLRAIGRLK